MRSIDDADIQVGRLKRRAREGLTIDAFEDDKKQEWLNRYESRKS
jgi:hypothetical protein